jgi:hypothetical protein
MNDRNDFALARKPSIAVGKVAPGTKHILSGMIAGTLAVATNAQLESWNCRRKILREK